MQKNKKNTILVVDDEPDTRIFLRNLLSAEGLVPIIAENKTEGLMNALEKKPSVIIINMMMQDEQGIQMYHDLKVDNKIKHIPVIILSTLKRETFFKCHMIRHNRFEHKIPKPDDFLEKPLETEELLKMVNKLVNMGRKDEI